MNGWLFLFFIIYCHGPSNGNPVNSNNTQGVPDVTNGLNQNGNHVCSFTETVSRKVNVAFEQQTLTVFTYYTCCNFWCVKYCSRTRLVPKTVTSYRLQTKYFDRKNYHCCSGWKRTSGNDTSCEIPQCSIQCQNGGICSAPDTCTCLTGFTGKYCTVDQDECADTSKNKCEQICINKKGGFECGCKQGYTLNADKETCTDINECSDANPKCRCTVDDGTCTAKCINSPGSFTCQCKPGYFLNSARECEDINECFQNKNLCDQHCINTPGSYKCGCATGFKYNGSTCIDIDECSVDNGGCTDTCHNLPGGFVCTCSEGFYLTKDRKTCKVIETTMKNRVICQTDGLVFLDCEKYDEKIIIIDAMYGRLTTKYCQNGNYTQNVRCKADNPTKHLTVCNNKSSCLVFFDVFGDPCPGIEKYIRIVYDCVV